MSTMARTRRQQAEQEQEAEHEALMEEFAQGLPQQYLLCRTYGHSWMPLSVSLGADDLGSAHYVQTLRCKCRVRRLLRLSAEGYVLDQHYDYTEAEGYLAKDLGRMTAPDRAVLRLTSVTRLMTKTTAKTRRA